MHLLLVLLLFSLPAAALDTLYDWRLFEAKSPQSIVTVPKLAEQLRGSDVVFIGEYHGHPAVHLFQLRLLQALWQDNPQLVLSLEQFSRDKQSVLDQYLAGELGERAFISQSNAWPNYSDYRPLIEFARQRGIPVVAANAPRAIVRCVGQYGADYLEELPREQRGWVARKLHLDTSAYRERFFSYFTHSEHQPDPQEQARLERRFAAQVTWDDTMAESITGALSAKNSPKIVHLAGAFHLESGQGTVERVLKRRPDITATVISPLQLDEPIPLDAEQLALGDYILLVTPMPKPYKTDEEMRASIRHSHGRNAKCDD